MTEGRILRLAEGMGPGRTEEGRIGRGPALTGDRTGNTSSGGKKEERDSPKITCTHRDPSTGPET